jgi:homoserine dehydrogenase
VKSALEKGKAVISGNKKMIAENLPELLSLQKEFNSPFLYEAACCASIPVIRNLEEYYDNDLLDSIEGIVNGSTNFILSNTLQHNLTYKQSLAEAGRLGYLESDHTLDTDGWDAKYKLVLLLLHGFGLSVDHKQIFHLGINGLSDVAITYAKEKNLRIKLVVHARRIADKVVAYVMPRFVSCDDKLYTVDDVFNGLKIKSRFADQHFFAGRGAGALPTAAAVVSDLSALGYNYRYGYKKTTASLSCESFDRIFLKVFVSYTEKQIDLDQFFEVEETFKGSSGGYIVGTINVERLQRILKKHGVSAVLIDEVDAIPESAREQAAFFEEAVYWRL